MSAHRRRRAALEILGMCINSLFIDVSEAEQKSCRGESHSSYKSGTPVAS
jgi:hypothetical protein